MKTAERNWNDENSKDRRIAVLRMNTKIMIRRADQIGAIAEFTDSQLWGLKNKVIEYCSGIDAFHDFFAKFRPCGYASAQKNCFRIIDLLQIQNAVCGSLIKPIDMFCIYRIGRSFIEYCDAVKRTCGKMSFFFRTPHDMVGGITRPDMERIGFECIIDDHQTEFSGIPAAA